MDTHFELSDRGRHPSEPLEVLLLRLIGQPDGLGQRLLFIVLRKERFELVDIKRGVGLEPLLDDPQLGSASVDVDHSGYVRIRLVGW